ncbi:glycosyltransferase family 4 protein [Aliiroseovarius crassostreae]|uniref:glycosyltransferase family 4 protein n=1 Tax=Aliiroseovarius crassostreae TaxID=154981 RepID=UPI003C7BC0AC
MILINGRFLLQNITGVQRVARELLMQLDILASQGRIEAPKVVMPAQGQMVSPPHLRACSLHRTGRFTGHLWEQFDLPRIVRGQTVLCLGNTAPVASLLVRNTRVVTMVHDLSYRYFPSAYSWQFRTFYSALMPLVLRKSDGIVTVSETEKKAIARHYPHLKGAAHFHAAANGGLPDDIALKIADAEQPGPDARGYGLYLGSLSKRKNAHGVLQAAIRFLETHPEMRFVIIGAGSSVFEGFDIRIPETVKNRLELRGQVDDPGEIHKALASARFLLFPSFYESSGLPPIEAMSFGCPVIASDIPSLRERCGEGALYCDPHAPDTIYDAIDRVMADTQLWAQKSAAGRERARKFTWRRQAEAVLQICEGLA